MKNLMVFASAIMIGASAIAGTTPRVYQYTAKLNTAVAKNAKKVTYVCDGEKEVANDVCYRTKGKVSFKGVVIFDCFCMPSDEMTNGYPLVMLTSSADKYKTLYVYLDGNTEDYGLWNNGPYNRIGNALSSKAKIAELGFDTWFLTGDRDGCFREWDLWHAGFGKSGIIDQGDKTMDLISVSGNVVGWVGVPYCSADDNSCPRCTEDGECEDAIAFLPCEFDDCEDNDYFADPEDGGVAFGTFSLKFNKTYSNAIKGVSESDILGTIAAVKAKAFKKTATTVIFDDAMLLP